MKKKDFFIIGVLAALSFFAYGNSLFNSFVVDDPVFITENPYIRSVQYIPDLFQKKLGELSAWGRDFDCYYRPVFLLSFMLDYHLWGLSPFYFHLHNLLLHALCSVLVFYFARRVFHHDTFAFVSALFFCLHPVHTDAVTPVFNRMDVWTSCLVLGAFLAYAKVLKEKAGAGVYLLSLALFGIALFSKESAIMLPVALFFYDYLLVEPDIKGIVRKRWLHYLGFAAVFLFYLSFRLNVLGTNAAGYFNQPVFFTSFKDTGLAFLPVYFVLQTLWVYFQKLILPLDLQFVYYFVIDRHLSPQAMGAVVILLLSFYFIFTRRKTSPGTVFFMLWFYVMVFPVSQIIPFGNIIAEHYVYLPSVGFCCLLGYAFYWLYERVPFNRARWFDRRAIIVLVFLISFFYWYKTAIRNYDWRNELTLWRVTAVQVPLSSKAHVNLANAYMNAGLYREAEEGYKKALSIQPNNAGALASLGALYFRQGQQNKGLWLMTMAVQNAPDSSLAYRNLGRAYNILKEYDNAIMLLQMAKSLNTGRLELYYDLGIAYVNKGDFERAESEFKEALRIDPHLSWGYYGLGLVYFKQGDKPKADEFFGKAISLQPSFQLSLEQLQRETKD